MGDDFRNVGDDRILNPAVWMAKEIAEENWDNNVPVLTLLMTPETTSQTDDAEFPAMVISPGGSGDAPVIFDIQPRSGPPGTVLTVTGERFLGQGHIQPPNTFEFNGSAASFSIQSASVIKATVPDGAIDGKIRIHSYDPSVDADVITYSTQTFDVTAGSVSPPPQAPADPSMKVTWDAFDITGSNVLQGNLSVHASQPMLDVTIDHILGQSIKSGLVPAGFFASGRIQETNPGVSKSIVVNTGLTAIGTGVGIDLEGSAFVRATFKVGSKVRTIRKRIRIIRPKRKFRKGDEVVILDNADLQIYIQAPHLNPLADFIRPEWNLKNEVSCVMTVLCKRGTIVNGSLVFKMWSQFGSSSQNSFSPRGKGMVAAMFAKAVNLGFQEGWACQIISGSLTVRDDQGVERTYNVAGPNAGGLNPCSHGGGAGKTAVNL
jgi:hypothetical protein